MSSYLVSPNDIAMLANKIIHLRQKHRRWITTEEYIEQAVELAKKIAWENVDSLCHTYNETRENYIPHMLAVIGATKNIRILNQHNPKATAIEWLGLVKNIEYQSVDHLPTSDAGTLWHEIKDYFISELPGIYDTWGSSKNIHLEFRTGKYHGLQHSQLLAVSRKRRKHKRRSRGRHRIGGRSFRACR